MRTSTRGAPRSPGALSALRPVAAILLLLLVGCRSQFGQTHYYGVQNDEGEFALYRVRLYGDADLLSKVKFHADWYNMETLEAARVEASDLFGESNGTESEHGAAKTTQPRSQRTQGNASEHKQVVKYTGPEGVRHKRDNQRLVLFMSSDPAPAVNVLNKISENVKLLQNLRKQLGKAREEKAKTARAARKQRSTTIQRILNALSKTNPDDPRLMEYIDILKAIAVDPQEGQ